jgi:hypothetical protein
MSLFKIKYKIKSDRKSHCRFYHALNKTTALDMFTETVKSGSLTGEDPKIVSVEKRSEKK